MNPNWELVKIYPEVFVPLGLACFLILVVGLNLIGNLIGEKIVQLIEQRRSRRKPPQYQRENEGVWLAAVGLLFLFLLALGLAWYLGRDAIAVTPTTLHDLAKFR